MIVVTKDVFCDYEDERGNPCALWTEGGTGITAEQARRQAAEAGWTRRNRKDYCPEHSKKAPDPYEELYGRTR